MKIKRRTEITIETERILAMTNANLTIYADCASCAKRVQFLKTDDAAKVSGKSSRQIFRLVENERLHFQETPEGSLLICAASLNGVEAD